MNEFKPKYRHNYADIAKTLYDLSCDMDYMDYEEQKEIDLEELEHALAHIYTIAENPHNMDYWRILWYALENLVNY